MVPVCLAQVERWTEPGGQRVTLEAEGVPLRVVLGQIERQARVGLVYSDALDECIVRFEGYVGIDYWESELAVDPITPTEVSWVQLGDREAVCFLYDIFLDPLQGSMQGSMR